MKMRVNIQLEGTSLPIEYNNAINTYTKDDFYCIYLEDETVHKYPTINIFRVIESYDHNSRVKLEDIAAIAGCDCGIIGCSCNLKEDNDPAGILKGRDVI